jgi:CRP-like cAMP-binding protein
VKSALRALDLEPLRAKAGPAVPARILRLVKGAPERAALASGQVDAVIDPETGKVFLLHDARQALREIRARIGRPPIANRLLASLPPEDYQALLPGLERVTLTYGEVLFEPGEPIRHVYFPGDCLVSLLTTVDDHHALEVGLVGREGMVGISLALGVELASVRALVQGTGTAMRMSAARFRKAFQGSLPLQGEVYRFVDAMLAQARQTAACNRFHVVQARLARWLLMTGDRLRSDEFLLTQAFLADMLGVRRVGVTAAACALQQRKLISYNRGRIRILDRRGLEGAACSCYEAGRDMRDGLSAG